MISVIIPTYKKKVCLENLQKNISFLKDYEIIIVNDNPMISMEQDIQLFTNIRLIENETNVGFGTSVNSGIAMARSPYVMLLNDDVLLKDNSFLNALDHFKKDKKLFAVSFAQIEKNKTIVGKNLIYWKNGFIHHIKHKDMKTGDSAWAEGGACLIDRVKYNTVGGFNTIFSPFYWEDVDLSYQAYRYGFHVIFDSTIQVIHHHESTIRHEFEQNYIQSIAFRNQLLFIWKNIDDVGLLGEHLIHLIPTIIKGGVPFLKGFFQTFPYLWSIIIWKIKHRHLRQVINKVRHMLP